MPQKDTVLQINSNRVDHPQVQSCDYSILNSFIEQTLFACQTREFFSLVLSINSVQIKAVRTVEKDKLMQHPN
jgi:hypothetical protein